MKRNIKINYLNGNVAYTDINGSDKEIIEYYNDNNFLGSFSNEYIQVKSIEIPILESDLLAGQKQGIKIYNFEYDNKADCYLY